MAFERIVVDKSNLEWAIRENFRRLFEELENLVSETGVNNLNGFDCGNRPLLDIANAEHDNDLVNLQQAQYLIAKDVV